MSKTRKATVPKPPKKSKGKSKQIKNKDIKGDPNQIKIQKKRTAKKIQLVQEELDGINEYSIKFQGGIHKLKIHQNYEVSQTHELFKNIDNLYTLFVAKQKKKDRKLHQVIPYSYFPVFQFLLQDQKPQQNKCSICQFQYERPSDFQLQLVKESDQDIIALKCSHLLHKACFFGLKGTNHWIKCPVCSSIYGQMIGDQPSGAMTHHVMGAMHCDGYPDVGTIVIDYSMNSGKRGNVSFSGTHRTAYLPDNKEGNEVLELLKKAFDRKLIFTVGRSVTTGRDNQVVWNGIHHKTNTSGGSAYFGYPDPTYFDRVKLELAAKGIY